MSLLRAHKSVFEVVRDALAADSTLSHIKVSVGARFQGEQNPEVIIQQSSFDINDLNTADYGAFEISVFCYANTYTEAAKIADTVFTAIQENDLYTLTEQELIVGSDPEQYNISQTLYHLKGLDLFLEHYDEDGYEANVLVRAIEAEDTTTGVGDYIPKTSGSPAPFYAQLDSRIQDLSDVNVNSLGEGQILKYDVSEGEWVNADLPLVANNGLVSSNINGVTLLSLADSQSFTSASTSGDLTVGGNLNFVGSQTKLIRPLDIVHAAGPLTIQSNGDLVVELDENADELDKAFIVKNGADTEVFKVNEAGSVTVNQEYILPTTDGGTDYFLKTDGSGQLYFATLYGTSGNTGGAPPPAIDTISELFDTQISSLADNQILRYDSGSSKWVNEDLTLAQSIGDLTDVDTTTVAPVDGQALVWDNAASQWEPGTIEGGVTSIVAGSGIGLSPSNGLGDVTVSVNTTVDYLSLKMGSDVLQGGASQQDFTSATPVKTAFNTADDSEGSGLTADTTNNRITVLSDGLYRLTANLSFYSGSARITPTTFFRVNGTTDLVGESYGYIRASNGQNENSNNVTRVVRLSANDYVEVFHFDASTLTGTVYATQALFEVESLPGSAVGPQGPQGVQGPSGTTFDVVEITADTTLSSSHTTTYLVCNSSSTIDLTVPASAAYDTYAEFVIEQRGTGVVTVVADTGVTINSTETLKTSGQYSVIGLKRTASNVYTLTGEREVTP